MYLGLQTLSYFKKRYNKGAYTELVRGRYLVLYDVGQSFKYR